jgi:hypothetical protein
MDAFRDEMQILMGKFDGRVPSISWCVGDMVSIVFTLYIMIDMHLCIKHLGNAKDDDA